MKMNYRILIALGATVSFGTAVQAQSVGNLLGAPLVAGGGLVGGAANTHVALANTVGQLSPSAEPLTDGVTNALGAASVGITGSGTKVQQEGLAVGTGADGRPLVSVGASAPAHQGSVAAVINGRP